MTCAQAEEQMEAEPCGLVGLEDGEALQEDQHLTVELLSALACAEEFPGQQYCLTGVLGKAHVTTGGV